MKEIHTTPDVYILNTVYKFRIEFYGKNENLHDPTNPIEIRVYLTMWRGSGRRSMDEYYERVQQKELELAGTCCGGEGDDEIVMVFDSEHKTLLTHKGRKPIKITNKRSLIDSIDKVVKEELTTKKFGNMVGGNEPKWYEIY